MKYGVIVEQFAEKHYIKSFSKKYKRAWDLTIDSLVQEFEKIDILFLKSAAETIVDTDMVKICKTEFKIAGTNESRKSSGNRCIVAIHKDTSMVYVLLVYTKTDVSGSNETVWWKSMIKENYPEYKNLI